MVKPSAAPQAPKTCPADIADGVRVQEQNLRVTPQAARALRIPA
jgi:hypothetical protein